MGEYERGKAFMRAVREGELAFLVGTPIDECPYKMSKWGLKAPAWKLGWNNAKKEQTKDN